ncbi:MAG: hypothetical protein JNJ76_01250 [Candidatus Competibacter sp.]|nr:hypothetical protein [Candidatus Competibacter sp.]
MSEDVPSKTPRRSWHSDINLLTPCPRAMLPALMADLAMLQTYLDTYPHIELPEPIISALFHARWALAKEASGWWH